MKPWRGIGVMTTERPPHPMIFLNARPRDRLGRRGLVISASRGLSLFLALLALPAAVNAAEASPAPESDFGKDIQLAPFVVEGAALSVSIHARTKGDRRYAEKFADEAVEIAYETLGDSTGKGLVIVGAKGEPHPIQVLRTFLELSNAGHLHSDLAASAAEVEELLARVQAKMKIDGDASNRMGLTFETFLPAVPMPLEGAASKLYQLAWSERFDAGRVEQRLKNLTRAELSQDELTRYDWVFYLPPKSVTSDVFDKVINAGLKAENMGVFKRATIKSALFVFSPVVRKAIEGMRKGMLYMTILRSEPGFNEGDVDALTRAYIRAIMPDLKPGSGDERGRALAAIEKQKLENAAYAKDPFVKPERLTTWNPADYASFEGEYTLEPPQTTHRFTREGEAYVWSYKDDPPRIFYPAGDRLLVKDDGSMTIRFLVDDTGAVTQVEERWVRRRQLVPRKAASSLERADAGSNDGEKVSLRGPSQRR